jgi:hypothetical protein
VQVVAVVAFTTRAIRASGAPHLTVAVLVEESTATVLHQ